MKNTKKQQKYIEVTEKLKESLNKEFYYESIFLEYSIIEDRLAAVLAMLDIEIVNKKGKILGLGDKINKLTGINDENITKRINSELLNAIKQWKDERNKLVHALMLGETDNGKLKDLAQKGNEIVKVLTNKSKQMINYLKKVYKDRVYYALRKDCYIREIGDYGYIRSTGLFNDLILDNNGKQFLLALKREPQNIDNLAKTIALKYKGVTANDIKNDAIEFYDMLFEDGYAVKGNNKTEVYLNNEGFSYKSVGVVDFKEDYSPKNTRAEENSQSFLDSYLLEHPYLSNFQIELTSKCNERCIHCYIPHEYKNSDIDEELYYSVLDQLKEMKVLGVTLSGGEPMAHPKFKEFLKEAKKKDFFVHVLTNLTLVDDEIISIMSEGNKVAVQASLYSMVPEHHDAITTMKGSFEKTKNTILELIENDIPLQINCPVMKANKNDVLDVIKWGHEHKVRVNIDYAIMAEYDHQTSNLANRLSPKECEKVIHDITEADKDYQDQILSNDFIDRCNSINTNPDEPLCGVGINTCCMVANGNVYPCPGWQGYVCGNLKKQSLQYIWNDSKEMNWLRSLRKRDLPKCLNCKNRAFCSPCMGRFANESKTGNPLEVASHFCRVAAVNRRVVEEWRKEHLQTKHAD